MAITAQPELSRSEKQEAMQAVLASSVLRRSEQLRRILAYICNEEIEGRGADLTESSIAVRALGRPEEYSPDTDSTVRTRTYELRRRLEEHYRKDGRNSQVRVDLPKGTYRPTFCRILSEVPDQASEVQARESFEEPVTVSARPRTHLAWLAFGLLAGALATIAASFAARRVAELPVFRPPAENTLRGVWGPLLTPGGTVSVVVATPMQLWIRDFSGDPAPRLTSSFLLRLPPEKPLIDWYTKLTQRPPASLLAQPNSHSPLWGDAAAAVEATRFLTERGVKVELLAESAVRAAALKERNAVLIGRGDYSSIVEVLLPEGGYFVRYALDKKEVGVVDSKTGPGFFRESGGAVNYGLVTVRTTATGRADGVRYIIISGINSDGAQAGMEFLTSPVKLAELQRRLAAGGQHDWPSSFQVVVRTISSDSYTMRSEYAAHRVFRQ